jgi:hypothetical protein
MRRMRSAGAWARRSWRSWCRAWRCISCSTRVTCATSTWTCVGMGQPWLYSRIMGAKPH